MPEHEHCYRGAERREICTDVQVLRQQFEDEQSAREQWRSSITYRLDRQDEVLDELLKFANKFKGPLTFGFWAGAIFITTIIVASASIFIKSFGKILKWFLG